MKKTLFALLLAAMGAAHAAPITVTITVQGALYTYSNIWEEWSPSARLVTSFTGEDLDGNGTISKAELTGLEAVGDVFYFTDYFTPDTATSQYVIHEFSYRSPQEYQIIAGYHSQYPEGGWAGGNQINLTPGAQRWHFSTDAFEHLWTSTDDTVVTVVSSVPEPGTIAMLGVGLSVIGLTARRRRNAGTR